jgi:hypothetical protein
MCHNLTQAVVMIRHNRSKCDKLYNLQTIKYKNYDIWYNVLLYTSLFLNKIKKGLNYYFTTTTSTTTVTTILLLVLLQYEIIFSTCNSIPFQNIQIMTT